MSSERFLSDLLEADRQHAIPDFIEDRESRLLGGTNPIVFVGIGKKFTQEYIHPESIIKASPLSKGFKLNDPKSHLLFADVAIELARSNKVEEPDTIVLKAAQVALLRHMGIPSRDMTKERRRLLGGLFRGEVRSVSDLTVRGVALCVERAATAHNMLLLGGIPSLFLTGYLASETVSGHAFQIVHINGQDQIYDSTNPSLKVVEDLTIAKPTLLPINAPLFLLGLSTASTLIEITTSTTKEHSVTYSYLPSFPATYEGFHNLGFVGKQALGEMSTQEYSQRAIIDTVEVLAATAFSAGLRSGLRKEV